MKSRRICVQTKAAKQASFTIHVENGYANGKTKRPRGPRPSLTLLRPQLDLQTQALSYYLQYHTQTCTDALNVSGCLPECISEWKVSRRRCPFVDLALCSMALAVFSKLYYPPAATEALSKYHRLLRVAQERIGHVRFSSLDALHIDDCLLAVFLMGRYETVMHSPGDRKSADSVLSQQNWSHHMGAMAILKIWYESRNQNAASCTIRQTRRGLIKSSLLRNFPLPEWMTKGDQYGEQGLELEYDRIIVEVVNLHHMSTRLKQFGHFLTLAEFEELKSKPRKLDAALRDWAAQFPKTYSYQRHTLNETGPWPKPHLYSSTVYSFSRPEYCTIWSEYFATRMLINSTLLRILEESLSTQSPDFSYEKQRLECTATLEAMAESLASTIPFCLERFRVDSLQLLDNQTSISLNSKQDIKPSLASLLVWPLSLGAALEGVEPRQQRWFRSELARLGRILGDGVLQCADSDQWAFKI